MSSYVKCQKNISASWRTIYSDTKEKKNQSPLFRTLDSKRETQAKTSVQNHPPSTFFGPQSPTEDQSALADKCYRLHWTGFYIVAPEPLSKKWTDFDGLLPTCPSWTRRMAARQVPSKDRAYFLFSLPLKNTQTRHIWMARLWCLKVKANLNYGVLCRNAEHN